MKHVVLDHVLTRTHVILSLKKAVVGFHRSNRWIRGLVKWFGEIRSVRSRNEVTSVVASFFLVRAQRIRWFFEGKRAGSVRSWQGP